MVLLFSCSADQKRGPYLHRFIDQLENKHVVSSPLAGLHEKFDRISQKWSGEELEPLSLNRARFYSVSTRLPVLGWEEQGQPERMKISMDGKEIPFHEDSSPNSMSWMLKKGEIEIDKFGKKGSISNFLALGDEERFEDNIILPEGEFVLQIWAKSKNPSANLPQLEIHLNEELIGEIAVGPYQGYQLISRAKRGWNKLVIFCRNTAPANKRSSAKDLRIDKILIKSFQDLILFTIAENKENILASEFSADYLAEPIDNIIKIGKNIGTSPGYIQDIEFHTSGKKRIEIIGHSLSSHIGLRVELDDEKIYEGEVARSGQNKISLEKFSEIGKHELKLECLSSEQEGQAFHLSQIIVKNPLKELYLPLAVIRNEWRIHDLSSGDDSLGLKKKFVVPNLSWRTRTDTAVNTIFAPPLTQLEFALEIPQSSILEFGYGLLDQNREDKGQGVNFKIVVQDKQKEEVIFSKYLDPHQNESHRRLFQERIDLSPYFHKKIRLKMITTSPSLKEQATSNEPQVGKEFAYWYNPVIYIPREEQESTEPEINIILISMDTLRADHLKCYGYERETSPNIDRLGTEGVIFDNAYSTTCWTLPAHISLLTSLENRNHLVHKTNPYMDNSLITLADILRENGYFTYAYTGGALVSQRFGFSKGFDFYREFRGSQHHRDSAGNLFHHFNNWIAKNKEKKFFLFLHTYQTHEPYFSPPAFNSLYLDPTKSRWEKADMQEILFEGYSRKEKRFKDLTPAEKENIIALYDGEIRYLDERLIKPLIRKLKRLGLYQKTMIIVTSDHGEEFFDHDGWLHGHSLYNELIRIPLIIKFPHDQFKNLRSDKTAQITDIMPTILEVAGIDYSSFKLDGISLTGMLQDNEEKERFLIADVGYKDYPSRLPERVAINLNEYKLVLNNEYGNPPEKFFPCPPPIAKVELYNLKEDPLEKENIALQDKEMVQNLLKKIYETFLLRAEKGRKAKARDEEMEKTLRALGYIQ